MNNRPIPDGCLSVVMPVYNEEATICAIVNNVLLRPEVGELVIINDASSDNSWEKLQIFKDNARVKLFCQDINQGKGAAIIRGFKEATGDYVIIQDADFEYTPEDYPLVIQPLVDGKADVVYGARFMNTPGQVRYFRHEMGNKFLTFWSNVFSDIHLSDMETCYKAFRREVIQNLILTSCRFGIEVELTAKLARSRKLRIWEVPISYQPRRYDEGKKIGWKDGFAALWHIIRFNCFVNDKDSFRRNWDEVLKKAPENLD
ncbi:MAG: glycosyltransferase family 2 protein [Lentisphaerae bacterium]|nr:glycosyltransferase family 2 protein [Lentisphaerota bacterium]